LVNVTSAGTLADAWVQTNVARTATDAVLRMLRIVKPPQYVFGSGDDGN
jgi:hypothetical protein